VCVRARARAAALRSVRRRLWPSTPPAVLRARRCAVAYGNRAAAQTPKPEAHVDPPRQRFGGRVSSLDRHAPDNIVVLRNGSESSAGAQAGAGALRARALSRAAVSLAPSAMAQLLDLLHLHWSAEAQAAGSWQAALSSAASGWQDVVHASAWSAAALSSLAREFGTAYLATDALVSAVWLVCLVAVYCWLASVVTGNYSQVDRLWSLLPWLYVAHFALLDAVRDAVAQSAPWSATLLSPAWLQQHVDVRLGVMLALSATWGLRLTYNFARKGGYAPGSEDYRWPVLRAAMPPLLFQLFNVTFIAAYQNLLLFLFVSPAAVAYRARGLAPWNAIDWLATALYLVLLLGETVADQQQWNYQTAKYALLAAYRRSRKASAATAAAGGHGAASEHDAAEHAAALASTPYALGFITTGLFRYSRHPNFFCEISLWWSFYLFSVAATGVWLNWSLLGAVLLTLLFQGSTTFTERLSLAKYPDYARYQRSTSRLIPFLPGAPLVTPQSSGKKRN